MSVPCSSRMDVCFLAVKTAISKVSSRYGQFVGSHPIPFIVFPILVFGGLGLGIMEMQSETDIEKVYFPENSRAVQDRDWISEHFDTFKEESYNLFSLTYDPVTVTFLFESRDANNIFSSETTAEVRDVVNGVKSLVNFNGTCAKRHFQCIVDGEYVLGQTFLSALAAGKVRYETPWNVTGELMDLRDTVAMVNENTNGTSLISAKLLKIDFRMLYYGYYFSFVLENYLQNLTLKHVKLNYELPNSIGTELEKAVFGDIYLFALTIGLCCTYASLVTSWGNPVSTRGFLACAGILAAGLSILGSMGLLCLCGVKFIQLIGVLPFLVIGIGVDDMFLLMSSWSETLGIKEMTVPQRLGVTMSTAGIGITITSLTDFLTFAVGGTSHFLSVKNFSIYTGVAILFCYLAHLTLFGGCLALHGRRVYATRHFLTCRATKPREELLNEGESPCVAACCGGSVPDQARADESYCEKIPRLFLPKLFRWKPVSVLIVLSFLGYLVTVLYGMIHIKQGLLLHNLVSDSSYVHRTLVLKEEYFPERKPVGFIVKETVDYTRKGLQVLNLLKQARQDPDVMPHFERCWLTSYHRSTFYNASATQDFVKNLHSFLRNNFEFATDVIFDRSSRNVVASRCFVLSEPTNDQYASAKLMERMRDLADASPLPVFAYHSSFTVSDQILSVLPATLKMVGYAGGAITVVTFLLLPHVLMVLLVVLTSAMIITGVFGFMYYWGIMLSSITMIHLVMCVGFSVDFSAHVCASYLLSDSLSREERTEAAIRHAAGPVLNGAMSTLIGVLVLAAADSYIFVTFFKVMLLVIVLGLLHAVLFLPAVLSLLGPINRGDSSSATVQSHGNDASSVTASEGANIAELTTYKID